MSIQAKDYPLVQEFVTDAEGKILKVVIDIADYRRLLEMLEDQSLYHVMLEVKQETPLSLEEALREMAVE